MNECTIRSSLRRLEKRGLVVKKRMRASRALRGKSVLHYQASKKADIVHVEGGVPRGSRTRVLEVVAKPVRDILDVENLEFEQRQIQIHFDKFVSKKLREFCEPTKKGDRGENRPYSEEDFVISISKFGKATLNIRGKDWRGSFLAWMQKVGVAPKIAKDYLEKALMAWSHGILRAEIPIIEPMVKEVRARFKITTRLENGQFVTSSINYSRNKTGLEYFGDARFVDSLIQTLTAFQHNRIIEKAEKQEKDKKD